MINCPVPLFPNSTVTVTHLRSLDNSRRKLDQSEKPIRLWSPESKQHLALLALSCIRGKLLGHREGTAVGCLARQSPANTSSVSSRMERQRGSCWGGVVPNYLQLIVWMCITKDTLADFPVWGSLLAWGPFRTHRSVCKCNFALSQPPWIIPEGGERSDWISSDALTR